MNSKGGDLNWVIYKLSRRIVVKFGGSSVRDSFNEALELVQYLRENNSVVVVVSALKGVTDKLLALSKTGDERLFEEIRRIHEEISRKVGADLEHYFRELESILQNPGKFPSKRAYTDHVLSFGERISAELFSKAMQDEGVRAVPVDAFHIIEAYGEFGNGKVDMKGSTKRMQLLEKILERGEIPVVTGFLGNKNGLRITLGRGGSDYTAAVIGAMLNARAVAIMSDVNGIYTADPRLVKSARLIPFLSYGEALTASKLGMKALHERTIEPLMNRIPLILGNTQRWKLGTLVSSISSGFPLIVHRELKEKAEVSIINAVRIPGIEYPVVKKGANYVSLLVEKQELVRVLNEIHEVVVDEGLSSSNDSQLWAGI